RWLKGETKAQREKIQKLIPAVLAIIPRELRHRLCIFDTLERRALLAAQDALSTAIDAHDDAVQAVYRKAHFSGGGSPSDSVVVH
ncbi:toxin YdaT family protein, partial [Escherichia coli]